MKIITINLPEVYLEGIKTLTDQGIYPNRSEAVRVALGGFLENEINFRHDIENEFDILSRSSKTYRKLEGNREVHSI
jgi:Arc/MetJ-type ribon-helix-helix transcriptional regulator